MKNAYFTADSTGAQNWNTVAGRNSYCIFWTVRHLSSWKMVQKILLHLMVWMWIEYLFPP